MAAEKLSHFILNNGQHFLGSFVKVSDHALWISKLSLLIEVIFSVALNICLEFGPLFVDDSVIVIVELPKKRRFTIAFKCANSIFKSCQFIDKWSENVEACVRFQHHLIKGELAIFFKCIYHIVSQWCDSLLSSMFNRALINKQAFSRGYEAPAFDEFIYQFYLSGHLDLAQIADAFHQASQSFIFNNSSFFQYFLSNLLNGE